MKHCRLRLALGATYLTTGVDVAITADYGAMNTAKDADAAPITGAMSQCRSWRDVLHHKHW